VEPVLDLNFDKDAQEMTQAEACFILPTYNEQANIQGTIEAIFDQQTRVSGYKFRILVIDDNSSDGTQETVNNLIEEHDSLHMITGEKVGLGDAYKRGFHHALTTFKPDVIFQMDSDGQHDPNLIPDFIAQIKRGYTLVIGSRFVKGGSTPEFSLRRKFISKLGNLLVRYVGGVRHIKDCTSGYRCISAPYIEKCNLGFLATRGYSFQSSLICELVAQGAKSKEIPIVFTQRNAGESKLSFKDQIEFLLNIPKLGFHSHKDFVKYSIVGCSGVLINLGGYILLTRHIGMAEEIAPLLSIEASLLSNFFLNNFWTFKTRIIHTGFVSRLFQFHLVAGVSGVINYAVFFLAYKSLIMNDILANLLGIGAAAILNYLINSNWTWKKQ
jgi:dolichol-phosphate mannosyltransferase